MRYVAAYLLAVLGGNTSPSSKDIKTILGSVGIEAEAQRLDKVVNELNGKDINEVMNAGPGEGSVAGCQTGCAFLCKALLPQEEPLCTEDLSLRAMPQYYLAW
uniref:Large ribosomal subunit protein P2 n=1 Tax=Oncorhynchus tshawytscha TaxID=74940 RepID=A0AAZ3PAS0_ONCTS